MIMAKNRMNDLIDELAKKSGISELIINNNDNVYVEKDSEMIRIDAKFSDEEINDFCQSIASYNRKPFDANNPILDGNLPDGSLINLIHKDYTGTCHGITIRRYQKSIKTLDASPGIFGLSENWVHFLKILVKS